jgi:hypothetical protein
VNVFDFLDAQQIGDEQTVMTVGHTVTLRAVHDGRFDAFLLDALDERTGQLIELSEHALFLVVHVAGTVVARTRVGSVSEDRIVPELFHVRLGHLHSKFSRPVGSYSLTDDVMGSQLNPSRFLAGAARPPEGGPP